MSPKLQSQIAKAKEETLAAFIAKKAEIDTMLTRLQELSDDHFNYGPDEINWGHVGTLEHYAELLKRVTDSRRGRCPIRLARRWRTVGHTRLRMTPWPGC